MASPNFSKLNLQWVSLVRDFRPLQFSDLFLGSQCVAVTAAVAGIWGMCSLRCSIGGGAGRPFSVATSFVQGKISMNIVAEQGMTLNSAKAEVLYGLEFVERACGMTTLLKGNYVTDAATGVDTFCTRESLSVCAGICLSDFSPVIPLWMFPVAITCGNTFILKPSEKNPGVSVMIASLAAETGLPDGVLNIIHGNHEIAKYICDDDDINAVSLISSNTVTKLLREDMVEEIMDARLNGVYPPEAVAKMVAVAALCLKNEAEMRPDMSIVLRALSSLLHACSETKMQPEIEFEELL